MNWLATENSRSVRTYGFCLNDVLVGLAMVNAILGALHWIIPRCVAPEPLAPNASNKAKSGQTLGDLHLGSVKTSEMARKVKKKKLRHRVANEDSLYGTEYPSVNVPRKFLCNRQLGEHVQYQASNGARGDATFSCMQLCERQDRRISDP